MNANNMGLVQVVIGSGAHIRRGGGEQSHSPRKLCGWWFDGMDDLCVDSEAM